MKETDKRIFLVVSPDGARRKAIEKLILRHVSAATVYLAADGVEARAKIENVPPRVLITDTQLPKIDGYRLTNLVLSMPELASTSVIIMDAPPVEATFIDQLVTGRIQFMFAEREQEFEEATFKRILYRAMNYVSQDRNNEYHLRFLANGDFLMREGEKGDFVYFVRKGTLQAFVDNGGGSDQSILGQISVGEFVGELSYLSGQPRSATVQALSDCELIEVPIGIFEKVLYMRPAWSKALMLTLSKRLQKANERSSIVDEAKE